VNLFYHKCLVFVVSAMMAGVGGGLLGNLITTIDPNMVSFPVDLYSVNDGSARWFRKHYRQCNSSYVGDGCHGSSQSPGGTQGYSRDVPARNSRYAHGSLFHCPDGSDIILSQGIHGGTEN